MHPAVLRRLIDQALEEDLGTAGDITSRAVVIEGTLASAQLVARQAGTIAGLEVAAEVFSVVDAGTRVRLEVDDGSAVLASTVLAGIEGEARSILAAERTALNFLGHLSGIATATNALVKSVVGLRARIADTRKTTPGLRALEKEAVRAGGGMNHRFGLYDAVMIKDNHIAAAGGIEAAVGAVRSAVGHTVKIEVEVSSLDQLKTLLAMPVDIVMLDNMSPAEMTEAVDLVDGRMLVEASGGVTLENVRQVAETGVDVISVGWITHSAPALDVALDFIDRAGAESR
jgi:nicotinate-nucleotide pyrophosphorylase (carboxylating)